MKRILTYLALAAMAVMTLASCSEEKKKKALLPNISGKAGEVVIVINQGDWEGIVGTTLRDTLAADCPFLPQREPLYTLIDLAPSGFNSIFQIHRNLVLINIDSSVTEPGVLFQKDIWAAPQCVIRVNAPDKETAVELIKANSEKMKTTLEQAERDRVIANAKKFEERSLAPAVTAVAGGSPHFPSGYQLKRKADDFVWISYEPQYIQQGILTMKYPVAEGENMMSSESLISHINAELERNVPGMFENTYMTIAPAVIPSVKYMRYKGRDFAEIKGLWDVHNDFMGGPFVAHAFYSKDGKEMIVLMAFVYAPRYDKRHYLRQVESILYSYEWAEEETDEIK